MQLTPEQHKAEVAKSTTPSTSSQDSSPALPKKPSFPKFSGKNAKMPPPNMKNFSNMPRPKPMIVRRNSPSQ